MPTKTAEKPAPDVAPDDQAPDEQLSSWVFVDEPPTAADVIRLLSSLPPVWGVDTWKFADFVQPLGGRAKRKVKNDRGQEVTEYHDEWRLYMTVPGRVMMAQEAERENDWDLSFEPEPNTPSGKPGLIEDGDRIVYREFATFDKGNGRVVRKPGMAAVKRTGGPQAEGTNPFEVVETSARGRALGAWGFGVLPGSGIASFEEMQASQRGQIAEPNGGEQQPKPPPRNKGEVLQEVLTVAEECRQLRNENDDQSRGRIVGYLTGKFQGTYTAQALTDEGYEDDEGNLVIRKMDLSQVRQGHLELLLADMTKSRNSLRDEGRRV